MFKHIKRFIYSLRIPLIIVIAICVAAVCTRLTLQDKILFPSNLLVSTYAPWKYEPSSDYPNGPPNKPMGFDNIRQFFPNRKFLTEEVKKGTIPLWNPYIYSGAPFMATFDTAVWYPLTWVAHLFSSIDGWNFLVLVQPVLSFLFMVLFLRSLSLPKAISLFGAFVYTFSGWMIVYWQEALVVEHSFLWLPLALYASTMLWKKSEDRVSWVLLVFSLVCSLFGGYFQMAVYIYITVVIWNIFCFFTGSQRLEKVRSSKKIITAIILSLACSSIQLIPSIESFLMAPRGVGDGKFIFRDFLLPLQHLITFLAPDFWGNPATYNYFGGRGFYFEKMLFIGIIPLFFSLYALFSVKDKQVRFWKFFALVTVSMGFAIPTSWLPYYLHIPVLSNSYPTRIFALSLFSFVLLSSFGFQAFLKKPNYKQSIRILAGMTVALLFAWSVVLSTWCITNGYPQHILVCKGHMSNLWDLFNVPAIRKDAPLYATVSLRNLFIPSLFLFMSWVLVLVSKISKKLLFIGVCLTTLVSSAYFAKKYVYIAESRFLYPDLAVTKKISEVGGYDRIWGYGNAFIETNLPLYYRWFSTDGYSGLSGTRYAELLSTITNQGKILMVRRSDSDLYQASEREAFSYNNPYRLRMMELLGVKYVLESKKGDLKDTNTLDQRFSQDLFRLAWEDDTWRLWEFKKAMPRTFFAPMYTVVEDDQQIVDTLYSKNTVLSNTVILEKKPILKMESQQTNSNEESLTTITAYHANDVSIQVDTNQDGFVVLTDNYYPGWNVYVDGKKQEIYRADYSFRAVFVPKGSHIITFVYAPWSVFVGGALSVIGVIVCVVVVFGRRQT